MRWYSPVLSETAAIFYVSVGKGQNMIKNKGTQNYEKVKAIKVLKSVMKYYKSVIKVIF